MTTNEMASLITEIENYSRFTPEQLYCKLVKSRLDSILQLYDAKLKDTYDEIDRLLDNNNLNLIKKVIKWE